MGTGRVDGVSMPSIGYCQGAEGIPEAFACPGQLPISSLK